jgi:hypothetical protein
VDRRHDSSALCTWPDLDVGALGPARVPFPVSVPYRPRPDLARLGSRIHGRVETEVLDADAGAAEALRAKWARLRQHPERCVALVPALEADPGAIWGRVASAIAAVLQAQQAESRAQAAEPGAGPPPASPVITRVGGEFHALTAGWALPADARAPFALRALRDDARPVIDWIASRPPAERPLHALGLALQEDLAWIEADSPDAPARAAMLHVCWPSGWSPAEKVGLDFAAIHAPVADAALLRASARPLSRALLSQGPFVRFVWTLSADGARSRHPDDPTPRREAGGWPWFRCERQVSVPIRDGAPPGGAALFLIRLHTAPLAQVADSTERLRTVHDALASMSEATLAYKGLAAARDDWLDRMRERLAAGASDEPPTANTGTTPA